MSRRVGSKNTHPTYVSDQRLKKKAAKLKTVLTEFVELSKRNDKGRKALDRIDFDLNMVFSILDEIFFGIK